MELAMHTKRQGGRYVDLAQMLIWRLICTDASAESLVIVGSFEGRHFSQYAICWRVEKIKKMEYGISTIDSCSERGLSDIDW